MSPSCPCGSLHRARIRKSFSKRSAKVGDQDVSVGMQTINYPHIPTQVLFPPAKTKVVRADVRLLAKTIGYVMGAGDEVPDALRQLGAEVTLLSSEDLARGNLARFDAIVTGVRAYNTRPDLRANEERLLDYVKNGGTVVVQYNVPDGPNPPPTPAPARVQVRWRAATIPRLPPKPPSL